MPSQRPLECLAGDDALARGAWDEARSSFEAALRLHKSPEALEGLGMAAWWLDLADLVFATREAAYSLYVTRGDNAAAARVAIWLAWDTFAFRGESAVAHGWLGRARRLLKDYFDCPEQAWLEIREASICLLEQGDPVTALVLARAGIHVAQAVRSVDYEMLGRAVEGLALVIAGRVSKGMSALDEVSAAVIAGELTDRIAIGLSGCYLIAACERVRDFDRAAQWCRRINQFCKKCGLRPLLAICRAQYASICIWRGTWAEAETELYAARAELAACRPAMTGEALVRLAELRRRQGRLAEATEFLEQLPAQGLALLARAEVALDSGDPRTAAEQIERYLRHLSEQNLADRAAGLELLVRAATNLKEFDRAMTALHGLAEIADTAATMPLRAATSFAEGYVSLGEDRADAARGSFEDAMDLYSQMGAPFEAGLASLLLARALAKLKRTNAAIDEAEHATAVFAELQAELELSRAHELVAELVPLQSAEKVHGRAADGNGSLSNREREVLQLVADGLNNQSIAQRLFVSDHTVHRHLANILAKLNVSSRAAAVAQGYRHHLLL